MHMVAKYETRSEADERAAFLQAHGIATHVSDMVSLRPNLAHQGQFRAGLWVVLDAQHDDAIALLKDPDHDVGSSLSGEEMARLEGEGAIEARNTLMKWLLLIAAGLGATALFVVSLGGP